MLIVYITAVFFILDSKTTFHSKMNAGHCGSSVNEYILHEDAIVEHKC